MKVSVIVPVYNCAEHIERCIRSIAAQTHRDLEIICVDDGSTDDSGAILDRIASGDPRIFVFHQANAGASAARNAGIDRSTGEIITFVDSDDAIEPDMYETLLPFFADDSVDIVHCGYKRISPNGSVKDVNGTGKLVRQNKYEATECLLSGTLFVGSLWNKLYRSHLFGIIRLNSSLIINEDVLANAELFLQARHIIYIDTGLYLFFERTGSVTSGTKQHKKLLDCVTAAIAMLQICRSTPVEASAQARLIYSQIGLYRWYVMNPAAKNKKEKEQLSKSIDSLLEESVTLSSRQRTNYKLMQSLPTFYRFAYKIYDKIRVPDWDVKIN